MAAVSSSKGILMLEEQLSCPVCLELYMNPKVLPCLHSLCQDCMERIARYHAEALVVICPNCRGQFPVPGAGIQGFPTAFYIDRLKESLTILKSDYHYGAATSLTCNKCKTGEALEFCKSCNQTLCAQCIVLHKEKFNTSNHVIIRLVDVTADYRTSCPIHGKIYRTEIDNFGYGCNSFPPERMISLIASNNPDTVPTVIYDVPVEGIVEQPLTLRIIGKLKNIPGNTVESNVSISQNASLEPPTLRQQPQLLRQINSATANEAFRKHFSDMSILMSIRSNRINFATMLYTEKVIPFECFRNAIEGDTADAEKATSLLIALTQLIQTDPEVLVKVIKKILFRKEEFKNVARKLCDAIKEE